MKTSPFGRSPYCAFLKLWKQSKLSLNCTYLQCVACILKDLSLFVCRSVTELQNVCWLQHVGPLHLLVSSFNGDSPATFFHPHHPRSCHLLPWPAAVHWATQSMCHQQSTPCPANKPGFQLLLQSSAKHSLQSQHLPVLDARKNCNNLGLFQ